MCPTRGFVTTRMTVAMAQTRRVSVLAHVGQWLSDGSVLVHVPKTCPELLLTLAGGQGCSGLSGSGGFSRTLCHPDPACLPHARLCHPRLWGGADVLQLRALPAPGPAL